MSSNGVPQMAEAEGIPTFANLIRPDLKDYCKARNLKFNEHIKGLMAAGRQVHHFGFGQAPFPVMEHMAEALKEYVTEALYLPVAGIPELRAAICRFHARYDGLNHLNPDDVIVGPGSKKLIFLNMLVFNGAFLVLSPSWTTYAPQARLTHHEPVVIATCRKDEWRLTPEAVDKAVNENNLTGNKILILCNPDNPTGTTYSAEQLKALSAAFRRHSIIVISDEIYGRLHYTQKHACLATYYPEGTILSTGMSKWASAGGWRVGYHIFPPGLRSLKDAVHNAASHTYSTCSAPMQYAVAKALTTDAECDSYILHTARIMAAVGSFCHTRLTAAGVVAVPPAGGYYMFPDFEVIREGLRRRGITTGTQMCEAMFEDCGVALMAGGPAFLRPTEELTARMCFVNFNGADALGASRNLGLEHPLPNDFVQTYCRPVDDGVLTLVQWVDKHRV